jgi:hypothetical protein
VTTGKETPSFESSRELPWSDAAAGPKGQARMMLGEDHLRMDPPAGSTQKSHA